jgi:hypothetical protein
MFSEQKALLHPQEGLPRSPEKTVKIVYIIVFQQTVALMYHFTLFLI